MIANITMKFISRTWLWHHS